MLRYLPSFPPPYRPSRPPYLHSRVSGNPAVACQDCGGIRQYRWDSRLRGNDGRDSRPKTSPRQQSTAGGFLRFSGTPPA